MSDWIKNLSGMQSEPTCEIPDAFPKRSQEVSLARNEAVLVDTQIPSTSTGFTFHLEPEPETTKKLGGDDSQSNDAEEDYLRVSPEDKLGEDELTLIFSNTWLSAQDLLNFRLVSKRWRDAATITLRRRDTCIVKLWATSCVNPPCVYKNKGKFRDEDKLCQLTELISMSPKFPATDFSIHISLMNPTLYTLLPDLLNFFKLHGDTIQTLRHQGDIPAKCVLDILDIYAPALESLGLSNAYILESGEDDGGEGNALKRTSKALSLKSLTLGMFGYYCEKHDTHNEETDSRSDTHDSCLCESTSYEYDLIRFLLSSLSKLGSIENVTLETLQKVLTEGKGHLIQSFKYSFRDARRVPASQLTKYILLFPKPTLSKVTLDLEDRWPSAATTVINSLNEFIESFKDTVQTLELFCYYYQHAWEPLLNIPPMKNLKSFTLTLGTWCGFFSDDHVGSVCRVCRGDAFKNIIDIRGTVFQFQGEILAQNYFPSLTDVSLNSSLSKLNEVSLMSFFSFQSNTDDGLSAKSGFFPKVDILKINTLHVGSRYRPAVTCQFSTETTLLAEVFPNIRVFKFKCGEVSNFSSDLWTLCPNVEFMEIFGIESCLRGGIGIEMSHFVDKVFTGFSEEMLGNLRRSAAELPCEAEELLFSSRTPSISDLPHLRELKLVFLGKWSTEFASTMTGIHAFSKMGNTKFIISYDPKMCSSGFNFNRENVVASRNKIDKNIDAVNDNPEHGADKFGKYEELIFGAIKPYVHIVRERR